MLMKHDAYLYPARVTSGLSVAVEMLTGTKMMPEEATQGIRVYYRGVVRISSSRSSDNGPDSAKLIPRPLLVVHVPATLGNENQNWYLAMCCPDFFLI